MSFCSIGSADDPHVASLLESLPFTSILIQSISSQTAPKEQLSHSAALLSLLETLNSLELRELLKQRLEMALGDRLEMVCSVNVILKLLEMFYVPGKVRCHIIVVCYIWQNFCDTIFCVHHLIAMFSLSSECLHNWQPTSNTGVLL